MGLFAVVRAGIIGEPCELSPPLVDRYPELTTVSYRRGGLPVRVGGWTLRRKTVAAITLWRTVFLAPGIEETAELLLHELRHVHQFQASRAFPILYLWESVRRGYRYNRFEADAKAFAEARLSAPPTPLRTGDL